MVESLWNGAIFFSIELVNVQILWKKSEVNHMAVAHKGSISMGLVPIPIGMYKTSQDNDIHDWLRGCHYGRSHNW